MGKGASTEQVVREIHRRTRRRFSAEEKIRIVLEGLRGEQSVAELCRREGLAPNLYYRWSKEFLEAGKEAAAGRHDAGGDGARGEGAARREWAAQAGAGGDRAGESPAQKKRDGLRLGGRYVRLTAAEKAEVIRLVEGSDLSVRRTLAELGVWACPQRADTSDVGVSPRGGCSDGEAGGGQAG